MRFTKIGVLGIMCLSTAAAYAQDVKKQINEGEENEVELEEVVITSTYNKPSAVSKIPVALNHAPLTVAVTSKAKIEDLNLNSLIDVAKNTTGVRPNNSYGGFQYFIIRGFSDFVVLNDGVRDERHNLYTSAPSTSLASVERVEVLKGAASVMFGHSALGGVINVIHKQPTMTRHANAKMSVGSWGRHSISAGASGAIANNLSFRTDFAMSGGEGWRHTNDKSYNAYLALNWKMSDNDVLDFSVSAKDDAYGTDTGQPHFQYDIFNSNGQKEYGVTEIYSKIDRRTRYADPKDHLTDKDVNLSLKYNHTFNQDWRLNDQLSFYHGDLDYYATESLSYLTSEEPIYNHYYQNGDKKTYIDLDNIKRGGFLFAYKTKLWQNQLEVNGVAKTGNVKHDLIGGYSLSILNVPRYRATYAKDATGPGKNAIVNSVNPILNQGDQQVPFSALQETWEQDHGIYAGDYLHLTDKFTALASLRFDHINRQFQASTTEGEKIISSNAKTKENYNALTYRFSLAYDISKDFNVYASTSNFFKPARTTAASGYIYIGSDGREIKPNNDNVFKPIRGYQYEVGTHFGFGGWFAADIAAFYISKSNMIQSLGKLDDGTQISGQVGRASSKGFEVSFVAEPVHNLTFDMGYSFTYATVRDYAKNQYAGNTQAGNFLQYAPKNMAYGWAYYEFKHALNGLKLGAGFQFNDKAYVNAANTMWFDAYTVGNAMVSYKFKHVKLQMNLNNIFDKTYYTTAVSTTGYLPEEGRNVMFSASFDL